MGFTKWLFKNGFGSIGSTAKMYSKMYLDTIKAQVDITKNDAFLYVINMHSLESRRFRHYYSTDSELLIEKSEGCLAMLIWMLICELPSNLKAILLDRQSFEISSEVIYECVIKIAPSKVLMTPALFSLRAMQYLYYRDNEAKTLEANNNYKELKFRTVCIHKLTNDLIIKDDLSYSNSKKRFDELNLTKNSDEFLIWSAEMNSNKYVFIHLCNSESFKEYFNEYLKNLIGNTELDILEKNNL